MRNKTKIGLGHFGKKLIVAVLSCAVFAYVLKNEITGVKINMFPLTLLW